MTSNRFQHRTSFRSISRRMISGMTAVMAACIVVFTPSVTDTGRTGSTSPVSSVRSGYDSISLTVQAASGAQKSAGAGSASGSSSSAGSASAASASIFPTDTSTRTIPDSVAGSTFAILINQSTRKVTAQKNGDAWMFPASMTKVMTLLVASEHVKNLTDTYTITQDILDYCVAHDCSTIGFSAGERVTVMDLLWGTILPSGADAALALGRYIAGSDANFVAMMNAEAQALGLTNTHFTNCIGLYDPGHFTTPNDMAAIMDAASKNQLALTVLATPQYTTVPTSYHPNGITVKNLFLSRIGSLDKPGVVLGAKTGFINQSKYCAVSYFVSSSGVPYICVTGQAASSMDAVHDHQRIYKTYAK